MNFSKFLTLVILVMLVSSAFSAVGQEDESLILRISMQDDIKTLNPLVAEDIWTHNVIDWLYDTPVKLNEDDEQIPYIAVGTASVIYQPGPTNWNHCTIGEFDYDDKSFWENASSANEATIFYDFTDVMWYNR